MYNPAMRPPLFPILMLSVGLCVVSSAHAQQPAPPSAPAAAPDPALVEGVNLRQISACTVVLPPLPATSSGAAVAAPASSDPLCASVPPGRSCIAPARNSASLAKRTPRVLSPEEKENPPPPVPPSASHTTGIVHVFDWLKALSTCRFQAGAAVPRPPEPTKGEFETMDSYKARKTLYEAQMTARMSQVATVQAAVESRAEDVSFAAILKADSLGEYDPNSQCFFPGAIARIELDDFKSRDTIYRRVGESEEKYRVVPRDETLRVALSSRTIADVRLATGTPRTVLEVMSHPICVSPAVGEILREQRSRNEVADYGVQAEVLLEFVLDESHPTWKISGEFVYRGAEDLVVQPADPAAPRIPVDRVLTVKPNVQAPSAESSQPTGGGVPGPLGQKRESIGCMAAPRPQGASTLVGALIGAAALVTLRWRRRPRHTTAVRA